MMSKYACSSWLVHLLHSCPEKQGASIIAPLCYWWLACLFRSDPCVPTHDDTGEKHIVCRASDVGVWYWGADGIGGGAGAWWMWRGRCLVIVGWKS